MHARKTRERKKQQSSTLQTRIGELQEEVNNIIEINIVHSCLLLEKSPHSITSIERDPQHIIHFAITKKHPHLLRLP